MGGLSHYIEAEGVPTAGISLVREHTEKLRPPRALWVPFELGRPLGVPNDREFQLNVLRSLLGVFGQASGPVLEDYPHDAPVSAEEDSAWSCSLPLPPLETGGSPAEVRQRALVAELSLLTPWYAEAVRLRGRTTFGLSGLQPGDAPAIAQFLAAIASGETPDVPEGVSAPMPAALRSMADDLKAYYLEGASAQPGSTVASADRQNRWLYHETRLGEALYDIRDRLAAAAAATDPPSGEQPRPAPPPALIPNRYRQRPTAAP